MADIKEFPTLIINLDEYKELVKQFMSVCEQLQNFEFKFSDDLASQPCPR